MNIIGTGNTATIQEETAAIVRKQFHAHVPHVAVQQEFQNHLSIQNHFPMTPRVYNQVDHSIRMEYLKGEPLGDLMQYHPFRIWRYMTNRHTTKILYGSSIAGLPPSTYVLIMMGG